MSERAGLAIPVPRVRKLASKTIGKKSKVRIGGKYAFMIAAAVEEAQRALILAMDQTGDKQFDHNTVKAAISKTPDLKKIWGTVSM